MTIPFTPPSFASQPPPLLPQTVRNGSVQLIQGQAFIAFKFSVNSVQQLAMTSTNWFVRSFVIRNVSDPTPDQNLFPGMITVKDQDNCTLQLNGEPDTNNYFLDFVCDQSQPY